MTTALGPLIGTLFSIGWAVLTPVVLFAYNRPDHLRRTVAALAANELAADTDLIIFSDGPEGREISPASRRCARSLAEFRDFGR